MSKPYVERDGCDVHFIFPMDTVLEAIDFANSLSLTIETDIFQKMLVGLIRMKTTSADEALKMLSENKGN